MNTTLTRIAIAVGVLALMLWILYSINNQNGPAMNTYSVNGRIEVINDCSGRGADNNMNVEVTAKFFYKPLAPTNFSRKSQTVAMALIGVTTKGNYNISDTPTNQALDHIELEIEEQCAGILCPINTGKCQNTATNANSKNIKPANGVISNYDYRFACSCH